MIIGLSGKAGSGKDAVADFLTSQRGFCKIALADPMKKFCREMFDWDEQRLWGASARRNEPDKRLFRGLKKYVYPDAPVGAVWVPLADEDAFFLIEAGDFSSVSRHAWTRLKKEGKKTDYVKTYICGTLVRLHRLLMQPGEGQVVDHINGDGFDNRRANLRNCSEAENRRNESKRLQGTASSVLKGVTWDVERERWMAKICVDGKTTFLGRFDREEEAALAYDNAAIKHFGKFARTNGEMFLTARYALQRLGTEIGRNCYEDVWVEYAIRAAKKRLETFSTSRGRWEGVVIPDVRFTNESRAIRKAGGEVWRIVRPGAGLQGEAAQHASERGIEDGDCDRILLNDGTLEDLADIVKNIQFGDRYCGAV